jgi:hypothetical protein
MRSPVDVVMGRVGGFPIREITRRTVPCYKQVVEDGREVLSVCLLIDVRYLYSYPFEHKGIRSLESKAAYLRGDMEHLRLREFQPGVCRYVNQKASSGQAS